MKPWPIPGKPPKYPLSYREPVPSGLIESIGHQVRHLDNYGIKLHPQNDVYLPPPPNPLPIPGLHSLPLEQGSTQFLAQHQDYGHQLALDSNQVAITHHATCSHGPNLADENVSSTNLVEEQKSKAEDISSYGPPPSGTQTVDDIKQEDSLPGLDGLNVISAQKSHSVQIPAYTPATDLYEVQFQQSIANTGYNGNSVGHDKIINNGLLQSIISAVEQPQQSEHFARVGTNDQDTDYSEVKIVFNKSNNENVSDDKNKEAETPKETSS